MIPVNRVGQWGSEMEGVSAAEEESVSYRYWVREATEDAAPAPVPRKLSPQDVVSGSQSPATLGSVWNKVVNRLPFSLRLIAVEIWNCNA